MKGMLFSDAKDSRRMLANLWGTVTLGAAGAIASQTPQRQSGFTVTHQGTGKYRLTFDSRYAALINYGISVKGANATYTAAKGLSFFVPSGGDAVNSTTKTLDIQMVGSGGNAVPEDSAILLFWALVTEAP